MRHIFDLSIRTLALAVLFSFVAPALASDDAAAPSLLNVREIIPDIVIEMRYASTDNFTGKTLYPAAECVLCEPAALRLARVQKNLRKRGLGLKIWDCYRPLSVQKKLWELVPDPRYVADPKTGSRHNRGASVDLTLVDENGKELIMPTAFDEFTEKAHRSFNDLPDEAILNRETLRAAMEAEGFQGLPTEWWHFDDPEWKGFALRDEPIGSPSLKEDRRAPQETHLIPDETKQLVLVLSDEWSSTAATLQRYERGKSGWKKAGDPWTVSLGKNGMSWGRGRQPMASDGPRKTEGDLTAPAGVFPIGKAYGYAPKAPKGTKWPYSGLSDKWVCVDDPKSSRYNEVFDATASTKDWSSAETMRRKDHLYRWLINVEQNTPTECGCGSCIFIHIWRKPGAYTEGCTAMDEKDLLKLLAWLDPTAKPHLVQLPTATYTRVRDGWDLP